MKTDSIEPNFFEKTYLIVDKLFYYAVTIVQKKSGSAAWGLLKAVSQFFFMFIIFWIIMQLMNRVGFGKVRGNFELFVLTGVGHFLLHNMLVSSVSGAEKQSSLNLNMVGVDSFTALFSNVLSQLYLIAFAIFVLLVLIYYYSIGKTYQLELNDPIFFTKCILLGLGWAFAMGYFFRALQGFIPAVAKPLNMLYRRMGMITSGKMFLANSIPSSMFAIYSWNPLFHIIDQTRSAVFLNYTAFRTSLEYPFKMTIIFLFLGFSGDFILRRRYARKS